jgi:hypothetical protein
MTSKYHRNITKVVNAPDVACPTEGTCRVTISIDVYDILTAWNVTNPATAHAIKKLLMPGARGHKSAEQDLQEAAQSIVRAIELEGGK